MFVLKVNLFLYFLPRLPEGHSSGYEISIKRSSNWIRRMLSGQSDISQLPLAKPTPIRDVHLQKCDGRSAYRSAPDDDDTVALEVLIPLVLAWVKQPNECAAFRVNPSQVWPFVRVAVVAGKSEISLSSPPPCWRAKICSM
jgi:hypothetical protein